jgi:hypothetical protein
MNFIKGVCLVENCFGMSWPLRGKVGLTKPGVSLGRKGEFLEVTALETLETTINYLTVKPTS